MFSDLPGYDFVPHPFIKSDSSTFIGDDSGFVEAIFLVYIEHPDCTKNGTFSPQSHLHSHHYFVSFYEDLQPIFVQLNILFFQLVISIFWIFLNAYFHLKSSDYLTDNYLVSPRKEVE